MRKLNKKPRKKNMSTHQMCSSCAECSWASCASSNNSSVTRKRSAAIPKLERDAPASLVRVRASRRGSSPSFEFDSPRAVSPEWRGSYTRRRLAATTQVLTR